MDQMIARSNSDTSGHRAKAWPGSDEYREKVAIPVMRAIDGMPAPYRQLVNEFGYIDVYRAWKMGMTPDTIRVRAEKNGGRFVL